MEWIQSSFLDLISRTLCLVSPSRLQPFVSGCLSILGIILAAAVGHKWMRRRVEQVRACVQWLCSSKLTPAGRGWKKDPASNRSPPVSKAETQCRAGGRLQTSPLVDIVISPREGRGYAAIYPPPPCLSYALICGGAYGAVFVD